MRELDSKGYEFRGRECNLKAGSGIRMHDEYAEAGNRSRRQVWD